MSAAKRLAYNSAFNVGATMFSAGLSFILVPIILSSLGESVYGVWALVGSVFSYSYVMGLGMNSATNREVPGLLVKGDQKGLREVMSTAVAFFSGVGLICALLTAVLYHGFCDWFAIPAQMHATARATILAVGTGITLAAPLQPFGGLLSGYQRYDIMALGRILPLCCRALLIIALVSGPARLFVLGLIATGTELTIYVIYLFASLRLLPSGTFSPRAANWNLLRRMLAYGVNTWLYGLGVVIMGKTTEIVLGILCNTEAVARYSIASSAIFLLGGMVETFCGPLKPMVSDLQARGKDQQVVKVAFAYQKLVLLIAIPTVAFMVVMGKEFLLLWTRKDMPEASLALAILAIGYLFRLSQHSNFLVLVGLGEHRLFGVVTVCMGVASVLLVGLFVALGWGMVGAALGNMVALAILGAVVLPRLFRSKMGLGPWQGLARSWKPALICSVPAIASLLLWKLLRPPQSWAELVPGILAVALIMVVSTWKLGLLKEEKSMVYSLVGVTAKAP